MAQLLTTHQVPTHGENSSSGNEVEHAVWVGGLVAGVTEQEVRDLLSSCGELVRVQVVQEGQTGDSWGLVTFQTEEEVQRALQAELVVGGRRLILAPAPSNPWVGSVTQEQNNTPLYPSGVLPHEMFPMLQSQEAPMFYQQPGITPNTYYSYQSAANLDTNAVFSFDPVPSQSGATSAPPPTPSSDGHCHVCSHQLQLPQPPVYYITPPAHQLQPHLAPLAHQLQPHVAPPAHQLQPHVALPAHQLQPHIAPPAHQLQPLTPMTPAPSPGFMLSSSVPTPTFFPSAPYPLPPTPAPHHYPVYAPPPATYCLPTQPQYQFPPPGQRFTRLTNSVQTKDDTCGPDSKVGESGGEGRKNNVSYFTSPFKRFSKFSGTPTPARFPLQRPPQQGRGGGRGGRKRPKEDTSSWYQAGAKWGQRDGVEPDIVRDLVEKCNIQEDRV